MRVAGRAVRVAGCGSRGAGCGGARCGSRFGKACGGRTVQKKGSGTCHSPWKTILIAASLSETRPAPRAPHPAPRALRYCTVDFFFAAPVSTGFGGSSFRLYFASDALTDAALANSAFASDSVLGPSVFASV